MILAGDIGGTKTTLAVFAATGGRDRQAPGFERDSAIVESYASRNFASFDEILDDFLRDVTGPGSWPPASASPGRCGRTVARPRTSPGRSMAPELARLARSRRIPRCSTISRRSATASTSSSRGRSSSSSRERPAPRGNRAVIAAGTGLGEAGLFWDGRGASRSRPKAGTPTSRRRTSSRSRCCGFSGASTSTSAGSASSRARASSTSIVFFSPRRALAQAGARAPGAAGDGRADAGRRRRRRRSRSTPRPARSPLGGRAVELFVRLYGAEAGNLALKTMATGGLYIGGGIAPKNLAFLQTGNVSRGLSRQGPHASAARGDAGPRPPQPAGRPPRRRALRGDASSRRLLGLRARPSARRLCGSALSHVRKRAPVLWTSRQ